jgi:hypothetical protein
VKTVIKESDFFRLTLEKNSCNMPSNLNTLEMIGEQIKDGKVVNTSTYQFFMTSDEINSLAKALMQ